MKFTLACFAALVAGVSAQVGGASETCSRTPMCFYLVVLGSFPRLYSLTPFVPFGLFRLHWT